MTVAGRRDIVYFAAMIHPARQMPYAELIEGLEAAKAAGNVTTKDCPNGRRLYVYTSRFVYEDGWDQFSLMVRGLILHPGERRIIATPFPKFFNAGERNGSIPELPFEVFEQVDGSLAILHHFGGAWRKGDRAAPANARSGSAAVHFPMAQVRRKLGGAHPRRPLSAYPSDREFPPRLCAILCHQSRDGRIGVMGNCNQ
jgi:hypothetical protein